MSSRFDEIFAAGVLSGTVSGIKKEGKTAAVAGAGGQSPLKVRIRPFASKSETAYQFVYTLPDRELHKNFSASEAAGETDALLRESFSQAVLCTAEADWHIVSLGKLKIHRKPPTHTDVQLHTHDRIKPSLIPEDADFLVRLGVSSAEGSVLKAKYDKFRQINKYLELTEGFIPKAEGRPLRVIDFGCGKAYLTFAMYHYLTKIRKVDCEITGLDLKSDVIAFCSGIAADLRYDHLNFSRGDIAEWNEAGPIDMVVTLHACDTATDAAIAKAVAWGASTIITVPCCQHELFSQICSETQRPLLRHGILKERAAALITDAARAQLLEAVGYKVDVIEFIDMEHTPKNIMIRARKTGKPSGKALAEYRSFAESWGVSPCLERLLSPEIE
jgi:SAM-dependent methyltransferase